MSKDYVMTYFGVGRAFIILDEFPVPLGKYRASARITLRRDRTRYRSSVSVTTTRIRARDARRERVRQLRELRDAIDATLKTLESACP